MDVRNYGLLVELPEFVLSGLVHVSELDDDFYQFNAVRLRFVGKRRKKVYGIGDHLEVEVANVDTYKRQVDFRIVSGGGEDEEIGLPRRGAETEPRGKFFGAPRRKKRR